MNERQKILRQIDILLEKETEENTDEIMEKVHQLSARLTNPRRKKKIKETLAKGDNMSRKDIRYLTQQEIPKKIIREYANMSEHDFDLFWYGNNFSTSKKGRLYVVEDEKGNVKAKGTASECARKLGFALKTFYTYSSIGKSKGLIYRRVNDVWHYAGF